MTRRFVDTSALYALLDAADPDGERVRRVLDDPSARLVTHVLVAVELLALVTRRLGFEAAARVVDDLLPRLDLTMVDEALFRTALADFRSSGSATVSVVDRVSFAFMRREGLRTAVALDEAFRAQGFEVAP